MFKVIAAVLSNKDGVMTAKITLSGTGYDYLFMGTGADAVNADASAKIGYTTDAEGKYVFEIPVTALDTPIAVAAHSVKNDTWFDREITFNSESMKVVEGSDSEGTTPEVTPTPEATPTPTPTPVPDKDPENESQYESDLNGGTSAVDSSTGLKDGVYTPDKFAWSGGSGRTSISCSKVTVTGGKAYATIVFSSSNYGYVKASGNKYYPSYGAGTSSFTIPVNLNANNTIIGMTTAMSAAHEITYSIYVYIAGADDKASSTDKETTTETTTEKLSEKAPEIIGLEYKEEVKLDYAENFKMYAYEDGITLIEVDMVTETDKPEAEEETAEASEEAKDADTLISELYQNNVVKYLIVPEEKEIPVGLEKEMIIITVPVESVYTDSKQAKEILEALELTDLIKVENEESGSKPEYKDLILNKTDLAILSDDFLWDEEKEDLTLEEQSELLFEITERLTTLGIPVIVDRSADEKTEEAKAEWLKVYGEIFGCKELTETLYQEALKTIEAAAQ